MCELHCQAAKLGKITRGLNFMGKTYLYAIKCKSLMKPIRSSLALLTILTLAACSKSSNPSTPNGSLSATVGGSGFTANQTAGAYIQSTGQLFVIGYYIQSKDTTGLQ